MSPPREGLVEVTRDQFFACIGPQDVSPCHNAPDYTVWETRDRTIVGCSLPGWKYPGEARVYWLKDATASGVPTPGF